MPERDGLADTLRLMVPLHTAELRRRTAGLAPDQAQSVLCAAASRCGAGLGHAGDQLMFPPCSAAGRRSAREAGAALAEGVAAAALLNPDGVEVLGAHFCARPHPRCPNQERTDE